MAEYSPDDVLAFWFPDDGHWLTIESHGQFWDQRMQGGMDARICEDFAAMTEAGAKGLLDHWADTLRGRLALLIVLDQFSRSLWRDTPGAFAQDIKATNMALETVFRDDFDALQPWEQAFFCIAISHAEGPEHLARMERITPIVERIDNRLRGGPLDSLAGSFIEQHGRVMSNIKRFGRHPHRNAIYGRVSTPDEEAYIAIGDFPHLPRPENKLGA